MPKPIAGLLGVVTLTFMLAMTSQARAEIKYPWCAQTGNQGGGTNCGFVTWDQCRAAISGTNGSCYENPDYQAAKPAPKKSGKLRN